MGTSTQDPTTGTTTPDPPHGPDPDPGGSSTGGAGSDAKTWVLDATTVKSTNQSEHHADELYLARVEFSATAGQSGSTSAFFHGGVSRDTIIKDVQEGETHSIPDDMGRVLFPDVILRGFDDIVGGHQPDFLGTVDVLFEDDNTPKSKISDLMDDLADAVRDQVAVVVEPLDLLKLDMDKLSEQLSEAMDKVQAGVRLSTGDKIATFLESFFNPDDMIGFQVNLFVAVDSTLSSAIDLQLATVVPASAGTAGALRERTYTQNYAGSGGSWVVTHKISS